MCISIFIYVIYIYIFINMKIYIYIMFNKAYKVILDILCWRPKCLLDIFAWLPPEYMKLSLFLNFPHKLFLLVYATFINQDGLLLWLWLLLLSSSSTCKNLNDLMQQRFISCSCLWGYSGESVLSSHQHFYSCIQTVSITYYHETNHPST